MPTPGQRFRSAVEAERPLQLPGVINAYAAILARDAGFKALYLSGAGVANASYGLPDLGITQLEDVLTDVRRITGAVDLPLLVDCDTGFGSAFNIARTVREMTRAGAAAMRWTSVWEGSVMGREHYAKTGAAGVSPRPPSRRRDQPPIRAASGAASGGSEPSSFTRTPVPHAPRREESESPARFVADTRTSVIPPRPEPFMPRRRPDFPEDAPRAAALGLGSTVGSAAVATDAARAPEAMNSAEARVHIERDPSVNKSLLLRLIAGVRGL